MHYPDDGARFSLEKRKKHVTCSLVREDLRPDQQLDMSLFWISFCYLCTQTGPRVGHAANLCMCDHVLLGKNLSRHGSIE